MGAVIQVAEDAIPAGLKLDFGPEVETVEQRMLEFMRAAQNRAKHAYFDELRRTGAKHDAKQIDHWAGQGLAYPEEFFPKVATLRKLVRIPDFFSDRGVFIVSQAFRDLVELFDGDRHQFVPLVVRTKGGEPHPYGAYYIFNNCQVLNALRPGGMMLSQQPNGSIPDELLAVSILPGMPFTVSAAVVGGAGIWKEKRYYYSDFVSTAFLKELSERKLTGWECLARFIEHRPAHDNS